jgi:alkanesulfonate monooxygenase SsuD/methylene tetrahydromethanopterin reductase-like flavin-dependent oxidoreductase (luciferase family)
MKAGIVLMGQNFHEYVRPDREQVPHTGSADFFREELQTGELAASLGFERIWVVEHHGSAHGESPQPLQQLAYFAGRTDVDLASSVVVLPWNDPVRVAEQIAVLDSMVGPDREFLVGVGRGSAKIEFDLFGLELGESNEMFKEYWEIIKLLLTEENVTYKGRFRSFENLTVLPRPRSKDLVEKTVYSWGSRTSLEYAAGAAFNPLFVAQGDAAKQTKDMADFNAIRIENGLDPVKPVMHLNLFVDQDPVRAQEVGRQYLKNFYSATLDHYQRLEPKVFQAAGNYAETAAIAERNSKRDREELLEDMANIQPVGTPEQVLEQVRARFETVNPKEFGFCLRFGGMDWAETERNVRAVAEILPTIKSWTPATTA